MLDVSQNVKLNFLGYKGGNERLQRGNDGNYSLLSPQRGATVLWWYLNVLSAVQEEMSQKVTAWDSPLLDY